MHIQAVKTRKITADSQSLFEILDESLPKLEENCIVVVTSKIVSICEGNIVPASETTKDQLVEQQAHKILPAELSKYGHHFTITQNTLIPSAGIDESNGEGYYILWPKDSRKTANEIRKYLLEKHGLQHVGVVITDSTCQPMRRGTTGIALAHSGFASLNNYIGKPDLFDRPFGVTQANIAGGIAAAAVLAMGEGSEQTPLCLITEAPMVQFQSHDPTPEELAEITIAMEDDLFGPFLSAVEWHDGQGK